MEIKLFLHLSLPTLSYRPNGGGRPYGPPLLAPDGPMGPPLLAPDPPVVLKPVGTCGNLKNSSTLSKLLELFKTRSKYSSLVSVLHPSSIVGSASLSCSSFSSLFFCDLFHHWICLSLANHALLAKAKVKLKMLASARLTLFTQSTRPFLLHLTLKAIAPLWKTPTQNLWNFIWT